MSFRCCRLDCLCYGLLGRCRSRCCALGRVSGCRVGQLVLLVVSKFLGRAGGTCVSPWLEWFASFLAPGMLLQMVVWLNSGHWVPVGLVRGLGWRVLRVSLWRCFGRWCTCVALCLVLVLMPYQWYARLWSWLVSEFFLSLWERSCFAVVPNLGVPDAIVICDAASLWVVLWFSVAVAGVLVRLVALSRRLWGAHSYRGSLTHRIKVVDTTVRSVTFWVPGA
ncbi:hypothetical protein Taro_053396 [Colocasia esculenta]|uniref:Uncharacterized protein n=1 Tax=Colocasia esculenta TaxID=4460 RepID=A0A843XKV6_COLES|nr:hypothetical protein [Colocasia esculenta]